MAQVEMTAKAPLGDRQTEIKNRVLQVVGGDSGKVLVVEDEVELAEVLEFNLVRNGFDVLVAHDGLEACRMIGREQPDLILLDLMLPLLNGWEVCRMVRSHHDLAFRKTPIIMLSALGSTDDRIKGYDLGADLYLPKPYTMKEVMIKSRQLVHQHHDFVRLNRQVSSLKNWADLQDQWQQALFHELRNQLTVISGMALHLQQDRELPAGRAERFAEQISSSSHYLGTLAENYLLVQRLEGKPGQLQGEPLLLADLLDELRELFQPLAQQKSCELQISCDHSILLEIHPVGLKIVLSGLIDNALKYSLLDGHVNIEVCREDDEVLIRVEDNGPGIPELQKSQVFEKFYRGKTAGDQPGCGLGLYVARTLTEAMGGRLELADGRLSGCCLELRFPVGARGPSSS